MKSIEDARPVPFDMFTMAPRNRREFLQAIGYQADQIDAKAKQTGESIGFGVPHSYITDAVGLMSAPKCLDLIYQCAPPDCFRVYYDGRVDTFLIETYPQLKPAKKSAIIMPGHA